MDFEAKENNRIVNPLMEKSRLPILKLLSLEAAIKLRKEDDRFDGFRDISRDLYKNTEICMTPEQKKAWYKANDLQVYSLNQNSRDLCNIPAPYFEFEKAYSDYPEIMREIRKNNFVKPTLIQSQMWSTLLSGTDSIGVSQTGSGKTLAFLLPAFLHIDAQKKLYNPGEVLPKPFVLILTPTRELALQIESEIKKYSYKGYKSVCLYGGAPRALQLKKCSEGVEIVIATPGRLADLAHEGVISLASISYVVLDEADRMLDMGFEPSIRRILFEIRTDRLVALTSATWPDRVQNLVSKYTKDAIMIVVGSLDLTSCKSVTQYFEFMKQDEKFDRVLRIVNLLNNNFGSNYKMIVFVKSKNLVDHLSSELCLKGINSQGLHGGISQIEREDSLKLFRRGQIQILIATDVASRGIDIPDITHVINYDFPTDIQEYVHRVGRTGRAGKCGEALSLMTWNNRSQAAELISILKKSEQKIPRELNHMAHRFANEKRENQPRRNYNRRDNFQTSY